MKGRKPNNIKYNKEIKEKKYLKPLEEIIRENLTKFRLENVIQIYFSILEKDVEKDIIKNKKLSCQNSLFSINKNMEFQLHIFLEILRENYGDKNIIKELYKYIFSKNQNNPKDENNLKNEPKIIVEQQKLDNNNKKSFINKKRKRYKYL